MQTNNYQFTVCKIFQFIFLFLLGTIAHSSEIKISYKTGILSIQNDRFERKFKYDTESTEHFFYPTAWIDKNSGLEFQSKENRDWFELCLEGKLIQSKDGGWEYQGFEERKLENGGTEIGIHLIGQEHVSEVHERIQLLYRLQVFPKSTFIRERLEIVPRIGKDVRLTKYNDQIKLIFPRYGFAFSSADPLKVQEIRLAEWDGEILSEIDWSLRPNDRLKSSEYDRNRNLSQNHMYHPRRIRTALSRNDSLMEFKGPIAMVLDEQNQSGIVLAYEHGSPDNDVLQNYLAIEIGPKSESVLNTQVSALKGAYYDGEKITTDDPYATVWIDIGYFKGTDYDHGEAAFWDFLYFNQSEHLAPRKPTIYYNTWGLQRDEERENKGRPQQIITEERVLEEIDYAHQLGVDIFVIDDGWQNYFGDWQPVSDRFPNGFEKIKTRLDSHGMRMGLWMSAECVDRNSQLYKDHPEWLVKNADGTEPLGQQKNPVVCFSSGYKDYFIDLSKYWIDQGFVYFKWDGLNNYLCYSPNHAHGDESISPEERAWRYGYQFILELTDVAKTLTEYNPDVIIVFDVTEKSRSVGLAFLSEARFFWMNNGASWYDDLSYYRTKSIRSISFCYNQIIPTVLQTSANYPHQSNMYGAQGYNIHTTLLGGSGFWGDLSEITSESREGVGEVIHIYKRVAPTVVSTRPLVTGSIGSSPEIYEFINPEKAEGAVIAFSGSILQTSYTTQPIKPDNFLCVLRNAYTLQQDGSIDLPLLFPQPDAVCGAFILSDSYFKVRIESSTCWLKLAEVKGKKSISFINGAPGEQRVFWPEHLGKPEIDSSDPDYVKIQIIPNYIIIEEMLPEIEIEIGAGNK